MVHLLCIIHKLGGAALWDRIPVREEAAVIPEFNVRKAETLCLPFL